MPPSAGSRPWHQRALVADGGVSASRTMKPRGLSRPLGPVRPAAWSSRAHPDRLLGLGLCEVSPLPPDAGSGSWFEFAGQAGFHSRRPPSQAPTGTFNLFKVEIK